MVRKERRAISTIVGALLFLVILISSFGSLLAAMSFMAAFQEKSIEVADRNLNQINEFFSMSPSLNPSCVLSVDIENVGTTAFQIVELFLVNKDTDVVTRYDVSNVVVAPGTTVNVADPDFLSLGGVTPQTITLGTNTEYQIKVVTELGTSKQKDVAVPVSCTVASVLVGELIAAPPEIASNENVTVAFIVVNRGDSELTNVELAGGSPNYPLTVSPSGALVGQNLRSGGFVSSLLPGASAVFKWSVQLQGGIGQEIELSTSASASGGASTGIASANVTITKQYTKEIVSQRLVAKPELFVIFPAPFGEVKTDEAGKALWGAAVVNPTDIDFSISRVTFRTTPVTTDSSEKHIEEPTSKCQPVGISHPTAQWSCPNEDTLTWSSASEPILASRDVRVFMARVDPGITGSGDVDLAAILASVTVHTSLGQFTKGNYAINMEGKDDGASANVYVTTATTESGALTNANMQGSVTMSTTSTNQQINVAVAEFNRERGAYLNAGGKLVVNIPAGFSDVTVTATSKLSVTSTTPYPDGSVQVVATFTEHIGDLDVPGTAVDEEAALLSFTVDPPSISETRIYVMYLLIEAESTSTAGTPPPADAFAEIPVRVTA